MKRKQLFSFLVDLLFYIAGGMIYSVAVLLFNRERNIPRWAYGHCDNFELSIFTADRYCGVYS